MSHVGRRACLWHVLQRTWLLLLLSCGAAPLPGALDAGDDAGVADASVSVPVDGGSSTGVPSACGAVTCSADEVCVRRYSGVDGGGGPTPERCLTKPATTPTCGDAWSTQGCAPTACRALVLDGGQYLDCMGQ